MISYVTGKEDPILSPNDPTNPYAPNGGCMCAFSH